MHYQIETKPFGKYDVVVVGGGTAGCFAAISAGREGAKTLLVERSFVVGGMLTTGDAGITKFTEHCKDSDIYKSEVTDVLASDSKKVQVVRGIPREFALRMIKEGTAVGTHGDAGSYVFTDKARAQLLLIEMLEEAGVEILYDSRVCLVNRENDTVKSVILANKSGFAEVEADVFIDATGDADVAYLAGAQTRLGADEDDIAEGGATVLGQKMDMGAMFRIDGVDFNKVFSYVSENPHLYAKQQFGIMSLDDVKESYARGDMCTFRLFIDRTPMGIKSGTHMQVYNLPETDGAIIHAHNCGAKGADGTDARELSGAQNLVYKNLSRYFNLCIKRFPGFENSKITYIPDIGVRETRRIVGEYTLTALDVLKGEFFEDSIAAGGHPCDIQPLPPEIKDMDFNHWRFHIPYRCLIPKGISNLLTVGRCISTTRVALGAVRPTAQCMAMGEAAGIAAAMASRESLAVKNIDVSSLKKKLIDNGAVI